MESARIAETDPPEIVTAHELRLWSEARVEATRFECTQCTVALTAASFHPHNVVQPHFRTRPGAEHDPKCPWARSGRRNEDLQNQNERDHDVGGLRHLSGYPVKLVEPSEETNTGGAATSGHMPAGARTSAQSVRNKRSHLQSRKPATSQYLRTFADAHWRMTLDERQKAPIDLPGINADTYHFAFRGLPRYEIEELKYARVFYADIRYTAELHETATTFEVELFAGEYDSDTRRHARPWKVVVDHTEWTDQQRNDFRTEFTAATRDARRTKEAPRCYALAQQDADSLETLQVSKRHLITVLMHRS